MSRSRRVLIDSGNNFDSDGQSWPGDTSIGNTLAADGFVQIGVPFNAYTVRGIAVTTLTIWRDGVVSLGPATAAQQDFMLNHGVQADIFDFPGNFITPGYQAITPSFDSAVQYGFGKVDFDGSNGFNQQDAIPLFRITWQTDDGGTMQLQFDKDNVAILDTSAPLSDGGGGDSSVYEGQAGFHLGSESFDVASSPDSYLFDYGSFDYKGDGAANTLTGTDVGSTFEGLGGDDVLTGGKGADTLDGGSGNDILKGGAGNDIYYVDSPADTITELANGGRDTVYATIDYTLGANLEVLVLTGTAGIDGKGNDLDNTIIGNAGSNVLTGGLGNDIMNGGGSVDAASYATATTGVHVSLLLQGQAQDTIGAGVDTLSNFENLSGSAFADRLTGDAGRNLLKGNAGDDVLEGGAGDDRLYGDAGFDTASYASATAAVTVSLAIAGAQNTGGAGNDTLTAIEALIGSAFDDVLTGAATDDRLAGGAGNDLLSGGAGNDALIGGTGIDTASYADAAAGVTVKLAVLAAQNTGGAGTDTLSGIENLTGSAFDDALSGDGGANSLNGGNGNDVLLGGAGNDLLNGFNGIDTASYLGAASGVTVDLTITTAQDTHGAGVDRLLLIENLRGSSFDDTLTGNAVPNVINGAEGNDVIAGNAGNDNLVGGTGNDTISGGDGQDKLDGGDGNDVLTGDAGNDNILGGAGSDTIDGGAGNDLILGGGDRDRLTGGTGADKFVFTAASDSTPAAAGRDSILDFSHAQGDHIDLSGIDAIAGGADNAFTFLGSAAFDHHAGELRVATSGTDYLVQADVNGDGTADFAVLVTSATPLVAGDFVL